MVVHVDLSVTLHKRYTAMSKEAIISEIQYLIGTTTGQELPAGAALEPMRVRLVEQPARQRFVMTASGNAFWIEYLVAEAKSIGWKQQHSVFLSELVELDVSANHVKKRSRFQ